MVLSELGTINLTPLHSLIFANSLVFYSLDLYAGKKNSLQMFYRD